MYPLPHKAACNRLYSPPTLSSIPAYPRSACLKSAIPIRLHAHALLSPWERGILHTPKAQISAQRGAGVL